MPLSVVSLLVNLFLIYVAIGILFAIAFVWRGVGVVDPVAREGTLGFKLLIIPGSAAFWPWLLKRWIQAQEPVDETNAHRRAAREARVGAET